MGTPWEREAARAAYAQLPVTMPVSRGVWTISASPVAPWRRAHAGPWTSWRRDLSRRDSSTRRFPGERAGSEGPRPPRVAPRRLQAMPSVS